MDIPVPDILPTIENDTFTNNNNNINNTNKPQADTDTDPSVIPERCPSQGQRDIIEAKAKEYFDKHNVVPMLNALLMELFISLPSDPIDHMLTLLLRHGSLLELSQRHAGHRQEVMDRADEAVLYANTYKLPTLFDELLAEVLEEKPGDVLRFAMSWMRWRKNDFIIRHEPQGYRAYLCDRDRRQYGSASPQQSRVGEQEGKV
eukprot:Tbor_TRINITY_DN5489_c5_g1::TRINITY_DN5489_c5_g1_i1::g.24483::m.24483